MADYASQVNFVSRSKAQFELDGTGYGIEEAVQAAVRRDVFVPGSISVRYARALSDEHRQATILRVDAAGQKSRSAAAKPEPFDGYESWHPFE